MRALGVTWDTVAAWEASCKRILGLLEDHLKVYPFVLGHSPSTADFGLLGPIYAHLYRDQGYLIGITHNPVCAKWYSNGLGKVWTTSDTCTKPRGRRRKLPCWHDPSALFQASLSTI